VTAKLKVGIVGCGGVTQQEHIPSYLKLNNVVLGAVCDQNKGLAQQIAAKYHIPGVYAELSEMLAKEKLDIVDICVPPQIHAPLALEALQAGCNVLMEKPMALKVSDCDRMIEAAEREGVKIGIVHNKLFESPFPEARKLVAEGVIGDFTGMRFLHCNPRESTIMRKDYWVHTLPGGLIGETVPHLVYLSMAFLNGIKNADIYAQSFLEHAWAPFDEFRIELEGIKAMSSIYLSYSGNHRDLYVDILGTEGMIRLELASKLMVHYGRKESVRPIPFARYLSSISCQIIGGVAVNAFQLATGRLKLGHEVLIGKFIDSIINNHQPPVTGEEGREVVRVMEMIVEKLHQKYGV
jgi:UDP-N-acetylglucosamine 3-dehydrogenase